MNLIDNYMNAVGSELPRKNRADIEAEIRSLIEDTLADRSKALKRAVDDDMTVEVLKEFGPPEKMAESYRRNDYLIGPRFFRIFVLVARIVLPVMAGFSLLMLLIGTLQNGFTWAGFGLDFLKALGNFFNMSFMGLGWAVIVMAILERVLPEEKEKESQDFDPRKLEKVETEQSYRPWELIVDLVFTVAFLVLFNAYPDKVGLYYINNLADPNFHFLPVLTPEFFRYMPFFNMLWGLKIALDVYMLGERTWGSVVHWAQIGLSILSIGVLFSLAVGAPILQITSQALLGAGWPADMVNAFPSFLWNMGYTGLRALFGLLIVLELVHVGQQLRQLFRRSQSYNIPLKSE
ncbi:MAG: hypothetical protein WBV22_11540 [Anaerolineaceae bacterium]